MQVLLVTNWQFCEHSQDSIYTTNLGQSHTKVPMRIRKAQPVIQLWYKY